MTFLIQPCSEKRLKRFLSLSLTSPAYLHRRPMPVISRLAGEKLERFSSPCCTFFTGFAVHHGTKTSAEKNDTQNARLQHSGACKCNNSTLSTIDQTIQKVARQTKRYQDQIEYQLKKVTWQSRIMRKMLLICGLLLSCGAPRQFWILDDWRLFNI